MGSEQKSTLENIYPKGNDLLPKNIWERNERVPLKKSIKKRKNCCRKTKGIEKKLYPRKNLHKKRIDAKKKMRKERK